MKEFGRVILETMVVLVVGVGIAFAANGMSKHGLELGRDYFRLPTASQPVDGPPRPPTTNIADKVKKAIQDAGFTPVEYEDILRMHGDPQYQNDAYVFIDARNEEHYKEGHIPRARRMDYVNPQLTLETVLPFIQSAEKVVLYCHGGNCDDSLLTAGYLRDQQGIDPGKLNVYIGGIEEWTAKGQKVERGEWNSGDFTAGGGK